MLTIAIDVLPVFVLIAIGWLAARSGLLKPGVGDALGEFVFRLAVPVLLFRTVATADLAGVSPWRLWGAYFSGIAVTWTASHLVATRILGRDMRAGVVSGVSAAFSNIVFIGLPLVDRVVGHRGVVAVSIVLAVHLPVMMTAGTLMMERAGRLTAGAERRPLGTVLGQVLRNLARNPLVIGLAAGALFRATGQPLEGMPRTLVDQVANVAGPVALISMGMALLKYGVRGQVGPAIATAGLKLLLLPACVFAAATLLGLDADWTAALVLTAAVPTGVNAFLIAQHFGVGLGLASSVITLTTACGVVTVFAWALLLGA